MRSPSAQLLRQSAMASLWISLVLFLLPMETRLEQRAAIKMCICAGDSFKDTFRRLTASWGDHTLSITQARQWFKKFRDNPDLPTKDAKHTGWPVAEATQEAAASIQQKLGEDRHRTVRDLAAQTGVSTTTAFRVMTKQLKLKKIAPKFMPKVLTEQQKKTCLDIATSNLEKINSDPGVLSRIIATDESWVFTFDPRTKQADMEWVAPGAVRPRKALRSRSAKKCLLILFFDSHGVICTYFTNETVDTDIYLDSLRYMREAVQRKRPHLWADKSFLLLQDNASPHTSNDALEFFHNTDQDLWAHPQYSPDLSPCDFWAFPLLKSNIRGHRFQNVEDLKVAVHHTLRAVPLCEFQDCFDNLKKCYERCVEAGGQYFEGKSTHSR